MRYYLFVFLFLFITPQLTAQHGEDISFTHIHEGLPQKTIAVILQDKYGFMWFGTRYGLSKYDGNRFYTFRSDPTDSTTISDNVVRDMVMDKNGDFWLVCETGGLDHFDYKKGVFNKYRNNPTDPNSLSNNYTSCVYIDHLGKVWIGTDNGGLNQFDPETKRFTRYYHNAHDPYSISSNRISGILEDDLGNIWIATQGGGLDLYNRSTKRFLHYNAENTNLTTNAIYSLSKGKQTIWIGTAQGPFSLTYDKTGQFIIEPLSTKGQKGIGNLEQTLILAMLEDKQDNVWIGTENKGLYIYNKKTEKFTWIKRNGSVGNSIASNSIWSLYADRADNIWIGTFENGISEYDRFQNKFRHVQPSSSPNRGLSYNSVSSFVTDKEGNLWIGTDGGGLNYLDEKTGNYRYFNHDINRKNSLASDAVLDLLIDDEDNLWLASWQGGLSKKIKGKDEFINYQPPSANWKQGYDAFGFNLLEDHKGKIWISFYMEGIGIFDKETEKFAVLHPDPNDPLSISSRNNRVIFEEKPNVFLIGSQGKGIDRITVDDQYKIIKKENYRSTEEQPNGTSINHNIITTIHRINDKTLWIGTFGGGINIYHQDSNTFEYITEESGLPSNVIFSIEKDQNGDIWASTSKGLVRINKQLEIEAFEVKDGLQAEEYVKNSSYVSPNGELFFGGINGFNRFFPHDIKRNTETPDIYITGFQAFDNPILNFTKGQVIDNIYTDGVIQLDHDENDFEFQVSIINYSQSSKNRIKYMLYPYQEQWESIKPTDRISFTNVPSGEYEFRVIGSNNDGIWNEKGASIQVRIGKPWYLTYFAYSVYAFIIILLFYWERRVTIVRERLKSELKLEHVELKKLHELDEIKSRFFANISHEFRTPLTLILGPLKSLISKTYKGDPSSQYRIMHRNAEKLLRLINQLLELSKLESGSMKLKASEGDVSKFLKPTVHAFTSYAERQTIDYKCEFPNGSLMAFYENDKLEKIVVNLISNAIKYTPEFGKVVFSLREEEDEFVIEVKDTGIGIPEKQLSYVFDRFYQVDGKKQKGTGIGLALTKELVELQKGIIRVKSKEGEGTTFTVRLKLGSDHLSEDEIVSSPSKDKHLLPHEQDEIALLGLEIRQKELREEEDENRAEGTDIPLVLLAEDNEDMRLYIGDVLDTKYRLIEAKDGAAAIKLAKEQVPDIIITDVMMPKKDGYEVVQEVKSDEKTSHIPIIMLTAKASQDSALQGFEIGADYYVTKPFNPKLLELRINNILKTKAKFRERLLTNKTPDLSPKEIKLASKDQELIKKLMKCIEDNMSNSDFTVDHICKELGMSRTQLYRKIKGLVGQTANEFIRSMRLKRAAQLIKQNEMTIAEVTYQVGFNDLQYFRFCFKKQYGVNPSEFLQKVE